MKKLYLAIPCLTLLACAPNVETSGPSGPKQTLGTLSGMVIGGALANDMADGSKNKGIATVLGAFVGGVVGQNIGAQLDERDRLLAGEAYNTALEYNPLDKAAEWRNPDSGNYGRIVPVSTYRQNGRYCGLRKKFLLVAKNKQVTDGLSAAGWFLENNRLVFCF